MIFKVKKAFFFNGMRFLPRLEGLTKDLARCGESSRRRLARVTVKR